jgi:hypothetical protein
LATRPSCPQVGAAIFSKESRLPCANLAYFGLMANFKRKGPKSTRAGCLKCKPHKRQGQRLAMRVTFGDWRKMKAADEQLAQLEDKPKDNSGHC